MSTVTHSAVYKCLTEYSKSAHNTYISGHYSSGGLHSTHSSIRALHNAQNHIRVLHNSQNDIHALHNTHHSIHALHNAHNDTDVLGNTVEALLQHSCLHHGNTTYASPAVYRSVASNSCLGFPCPAMVKWGDMLARLVVS